MDEITPQPEEQTVTITIPTDGSATALNTTEQPIGTIVDGQGTIPTDGAIPLTQQPVMETVEVEQTPVIPNIPDPMAESSGIATPPEEAIKIDPTPPKHAGGRPCEYCQNKEAVDKTTLDYIMSARKARIDKKPFIPYQQELADMLDIDGETLYLWTIKHKEGTAELEHPEFSGLIKKLNTLKELLLLQRTTGRFNPTGAIFQLKTKHGYIETEKQILAGSQNEPLEITITEDTHHAESE